MSFYYAKFNSSSGKVETAVGAGAAFSVLFWNTVAAAGVINGMADNNNALLATSALIAMVTAASASRLKQMFLACSINAPDYYNGLPLKALAKATGKGNAPRLKKALETASCIQTYGGEIAQLYAEEAIERLKQRGQAAQAWFEQVGDKINDRTAALVATVGILISRKIPALKQAQVVTQTPSFPPQEAASTSTPSSALPEKTHIEQTQPLRFPEPADSSGEGEEESLDAIDERRARL